MNNPPKSIAVIGAGVSGLAFANRSLELARSADAPLRVSVLEESPRAGGIVETEEREGFLLEKGPDSYLSGNPRMTALCDRLGISGEIIATEIRHRRTFIAHRAELVALPAGFHLIAPKNLFSFLATPLFSMHGKIRMLGEFVLPRARIVVDESVASFVRRRFGREALERVGQPMIAGVYSGDPEELSILSTMPRFREAEIKYGSVLRWMQSPDFSPGSSAGPRYGLFQSFRGGMRALTGALEAALPAGAFVPGFKTVSVSHSADGWTALSEKGQSVTADALCLALPARRASALVKPLSGVLAGCLDEIQYESVAVLNFAFDARDIEHSLDGFGFVVPRTEGLSLMACTFAHRKFAGRAPQGRAFLRAFVGGAFGRRLFHNLSDRELEQAALKDLHLLLGLRAKPLFSSVARHAHALPQYRVGHRELVGRIESAASKLPLLELTGSSYRGTGIPDCVADAEACAERVFKVS